MQKFPAYLLYALLFLTSSARADNAGNGRSPLEIGIDRSNLNNPKNAWTIGPPAEPRIYPFNALYIKGKGLDPKTYEEARKKILNGVAQLHPAWFRDGFGNDDQKSISLFVDEVSQVHALGIKMLAVFGQSNDDFDPNDYIPKEESGCSWGTYPLRRIDLSKFEKRLRDYFNALQKAGISVDAFEVGNELDQYCNDADNPTNAVVALHHWKFFMTPAQINTFVEGYAPFLKTAVGVIREYFPKAQIITFGMSYPVSAPLIQALANYTDSSGNTSDYTQLVDGYGSHIYPSSDTTLNMVQTVTKELINQGAILPHNDQKPIWITEWNESGSVTWSNKKWPFHPATAANGLSEDKNDPDDQGAYPAMTRAEVIRTFYKDVISKLRNAEHPVNIRNAFYYSYDSVASYKETKLPVWNCDETVFNTSRGITGACYSGVIDPVTGQILPDISSAVANN